MIYLNNGSPIHFQSAGGGFWFKEINFKASSVLLSVQKWTIGWGRSLALWQWDTDEDPIQWHVLTFTESCLRRGWETTRWDSGRHGYLRWTIPPLDSIIYLMWRKTSIHAKTWEECDSASMAKTWRLAIGSAVRLFQIASRGRHDWGATYHHLHLALLRWSWMDLFRNGLS